MADEPSEPVAHATTAHECNGDREGLACNTLSDSGASISDGATETTSSLNPSCVAQRLQHSLAQNRELHSVATGRTKPPDELRLLTNY